MNYMSDVAKLLGVEIGEEFKVKSFENNFKFTDSGLLYYNEYNDFHKQWTRDSYMFHGLLTGKNKIIKISKPDNVENKPILTDKEKKYLSRVIRPFRGKVQYICKNNDFIDICYEDDIEKHCFALPIFKEYIKCEGMEDGKQYSLEDLDL